MTQREMDIARVEAKLAVQKIAEEFIRDYLAERLQGEQNAIRPGDELPENQVPY